jgi:hypothetical protein
MKSSQLHFAPFPHETGADSLDETIEEIDLLHSVGELADHLHCFLPGAFVLFS